MAGAATPGRVNLQQYEILRDNTIAVTQPDRILKHSQARRRLDYQQLVRCESQDEEAEPRPHTHTTSSLAIIDELEYEPARRLVDRLVRAISARVCFHEISKTRGSFTDSPGQPDPPSFMEFILQHLRHAYTHWVETGREETTLSELGWPTCFKFLQQLRTTFLDDWDGEAELNRWGAAGSAVQIMAYLYEHHEDLGLPVESLQFRGLGDELDRLHNRDLILKRWFERSPDRSTLNLLSYPFLFAPKYLILCSRIINSMFMNYAIRTSMVLRRQHEDYVRQQRVRNVRDHLAARLYHSMHEHLVVNIRREHILEDAFYALWQREKRELFLPLRVRMGMNEGEIGHDLGGVQTEFFRLAFIEALKPETGMFVTDRESRMTWFQPACLEPLNRFEQLGLLVSLALYNNVMLPFTFPHALYRKLQGLPVDNLRHIRDGWPALAKGLDSMLSWDDGDVRAVFWRSYVFSFEAYDQIIDVDMEKFGREDQWPAVYATEEAEGQTGIRDALVNVPSPHTNPSTDLASIAWRRPRPLNPTTRDTDGSDDTTDEALGSEEPQAVTNANRAQYVADYIFWLTDKSIRPQYMAFERGFRTFLKPKQVSIHTPGSLQTAIEGLRREINIDDLRASTTYEGYSAEHRVVRWFWRVVGAYSHEQKCKLLEFVTATSRVPVNGAAGIIFEIRWGGPDGERLPSSQTCFGALYLLEYDSLDKLSLKLGIALEHGLGFGVV
ncbi:hypothetical protein B0A49_02506 [Cryomyces minteri]|uniref:HECT-type E3 ubiquitin transferase n=1 Tax=Cryomyces minteri TaxID=331657 RepID=A0A4U0XU88_9PEZI|nr:hypothetical protein B0A49_02506 [Cryomyces minteri]